MGGRVRLSRGHARAIRSCGACGKPRHDIRSCRDYKAVAGVRLGEVLAWLRVIAIEAQAGRSCWIYEQTGGAEPWDRVEASLEAASGQLEVPNEIRQLEVPNEIRVRNALTLTSRALELWPRAGADGPRLAPAVHALLGKAEHALHLLRG